jgi:hypothetical protein
VGCMGRRSPGRSGGRGAPTPPGPCGRGRWKIGWPGTGRPGAGRRVPIGALAWGAGVGAGRGGGALYTGRGPVCGTIMRGAGGCGGPVTTGGAGRGATGVCEGAEAVNEGAAGGGGATTAAGAGGAGRGAATGGAGGAGATAGLSATGAATTGRTGGAGVTGAATVATGAGGGVGFGGTGGATAGLEMAAGGAGGAGAAGAGRTGGAAAASFFCVIAFSTSPGREMCDKSILVRISSSPRSGRADRADGVCASDEPRMWARTFSASKSSSELEWVFFSVTPTSGSASRMALLLTSSSLARSLIRTLLIRPFLYPRCA